MSTSRYSARVVIRREYLLRGVVQGVGFRPHVAVVAARHPITGFVGNDDLQVFIETQGAAPALDAFLDDLLATLPPLARVISTARRDLAPVPCETGFTIVASRHLPGARTLIPPDVATCPDCLADMADPGNRRHGYAFTTCTNCGPRLTIIEDLPYDRPATTLRVFPMCAACRAEYTDPADRRYHAQPISCYACGPRLWLETPPKPASPHRAPSVAPDAPPDHPHPHTTRDPAAARTDHDATLADARARLRAGEILAVKGLGGFHLMCDARHPDAVARLRVRKRRSGKPFAVMVRDQTEARRLAHLTDDQAELLASAARPIVIAPMAPGYDLADGVAPGLADVGLLLPYAPLHWLLLADGLALVATSGNLSEEPLAFTNADARARLGGLADAFLLHDRGIHVPVEDSVFLAAPAGDRTPPVTIPSRRSRGYAPLPVVLPAPGPVVLAVGGELKNTFALATGDLAFVSAHLGDMGSLASQRAFEASVAQLVDIHRVRPEVVACDLHPNYATTAWAERYADAHDIALVPVQHHHAHARALLAEHGVTRTAVVATLDGTGYGTDGTIWGGEVLRVDPDGWARAWHVPTFGLVGGDRAVRQPWRVARGLAAAWGVDVADRFAGVPDADLRLVDSQVASGFGVVATSSAGRLFDAASALLGICRETSYEAQAAMELERAASGWAREHPETTRHAPSDEPPDTALARAVEHLLDDARSVGERAWRFHVEVADAVARAVADAATLARTDVVGVTGGVAMNRLFTARLTRTLDEHGLTVLTHRVVPPNDGGLSLGQAWAARLEWGSGPRP